MPMRDSVAAQHRTPKIFAVMVLMALVTTAMTGPLLSLSLNWGRRRTLAPAGPLARSS